MRFRIEGLGDEVPGRVTILVDQKDLENPEGGVFEYTNNEWTTVRVYITPHEEVEQQDDVEVQNALSLYRLHEQLHEEAKTREVEEWEWKQRTLDEDIDAFEELMGYQDEENK